MYMSVPSLYLKLNLGQSSVFTTDKFNVKAESSYIVGELNKRFDTNNSIYLSRVPDNNTIKVSIFDKTTDLINTNNIQYIIQLYLEKVED